MFLAFFSAKLYLFNFCINSLQLSFRPFSFTSLLNIQASEPGGTPLHFSVTSGQYVITFWKIATCLVIMHLTVTYLSDSQILWLLECEGEQELEKQFSLMVSSVSLFGPTAYAFLECLQLEKHKELF